MNNLYQKLKKYSLEDAIGFEKTDRQFLALEKLYREKSFSDEIYLFLIIANSLVCYQLSGSGEDYWEEFGEVVANKKINNFEGVKRFFVEFLPASKNNRRLVEVKLGRIEKLESFYFNLTVDNVQPSGTRRLDLWEGYYKNMGKLSCDLANTMKQKTDAKTIVFAVKMFSYGARNVWGYLEYFPDTLSIPIDSRLTKIYQNYNTDDLVDIKTFYKNLSDELNIPQLHLDGLLWINF